MKAILHLSHRSGLSRYSLGLPVVLCIVLWLTTADFRDPQNLFNFSGQIAALLMAALGQLLVTLVGGIDLSVGSVISLAACLVAVQGDAVTGIALALAAAALIGLVNGLGVAVAGVHPLVMTLATATFVQGLCYMVLPIPGGQIPAGLTMAVRGAVGPLPLALLWCGIVVAGMGWLVHRSRFGLHLFATGAHARSARFNGVGVVRVTVLAYMACSLMAACAGIYLCARVSAGDPTLGSAFALESVAAVALGGVQLTGGVGSVAAVVAGALSLGLLTNGLNLFGISPFMRGVLTGCLLLAAVSVQRRRQVGL